MSEPASNPYYEIEWSLEDTSGDCSPSGSTTIRSGTESFNDINEKDSIIDEIKNRNAISLQRKLYVTFKTFVNGEIETEERIDFREKYPF